MCQDPGEQRGLDIQVQDSLTVIAHIDKVMKTAYRIFHLVSWGIAHKAGRLWYNFIKY